MKILILLSLMLLSSCAKECRVYCSEKSCAAIYREAYQLTYSSRMDGLKPSEAYNFCFNYMDIKK